MVADKKGLKDFKDHQFFNDGTDAYKKPYEDPVVINKLDPFPYYNPIHEKNVIEPSPADGVYAVPVDLKTKHIYEDNDKAEKEMKRLILKPGTYYDPSRLFFRPEHDPIKDALARHEAEALRPKSQKLREVEKQKQLIKDNNDKILGKYKEFDPSLSQGTNWMRNKLKHFFFKRNGPHVPEVKLPKSASVYYDASAKPASAWI